MPAPVDINVLSYRQRRAQLPLLSGGGALREAEELLAQLDVPCPRMWAYAERYGLDELLSEDFQHGRLYGRVRVVDPFAET